MEDWNKRTVAQLKAECTKRGLDPVGKKAELVQRIVTHEENALLAGDDDENMETTENKDTKEELSGDENGEAEKAAEGQGMDTTEVEDEEGDSHLISKPAPIDIPYKKDVSIEIMRESRVRMVAFGPCSLEMLRDENFLQYLRKGETFSVNFISSRDPGYCQVRMKSYEAAKNLVETYNENPYNEAVGAKQLSYEGSGNDLELVQEPRDVRVLYCHGLPVELTESELADLVPEALLVYIIKDDDRKSKGCGYLEFRDSTALKEYLEACDAIPYGDVNITLHQIPKTTIERKRMMEQKKMTTKVPIKKIMGEDIIKESHEREVVCGPLEVDDLKNEKFSELLGKTVCFNIRFHTEGGPGHAQLRFVSFEEAVEVEKELTAEPFKEDLKVKKLSQEMGFLTRTVGQNAKINAVLRGEKENPLEYLEDRIQYLHNLPDSATEEQLKELTPQPQGVYIIKDDDRTPKGYGYLEFQTSAKMKEFLEAVKYFELDSHKVELFNIPKVQALKKDKAKEIVKVPTRREAFQEVIKEGNDKEIAFGPLTVEDLKIDSVQNILKKSEGFSVWFYGEKNPGHAQVRLKTYDEAQVVVTELSDTPYKDGVVAKMIGSLLHLHEKSCGYSGRTAGRSEKISAFLQGEKVDEKHIDPLESRLLYVHNLPKSAMEEHLHKLVPEAATACIPRDDDRNSKGHGYLEFKSKSELDDFLKKSVRGAKRRVFALDNQQITFHLIPTTTSTVTASAGPMKKGPMQSPVNKMRKMDSLMGGPGRFGRFDNPRWGGNQGGFGNPQNRGNFGQGGFNRPNPNFGNQRPGFNDNMGGNFNRNQGPGGFGNQGMGFGNQGGGNFGNQPVGGQPQGSDAVNLIVELGQILSRQSVSNPSQGMGQNLSNQPSNFGGNQQGFSNQQGFGNQGQQQTFGNNQRSQQMSGFSPSGNRGFESQGNRSFESQGNRGFESQGNRGFESQSSFNSNSSGGNRNFDHQSGFNNNNTSFGYGNQSYGNQRQQADYGNDQDRWNRKRKASFSSANSSFSAQGKMQRQGQNIGKYGTGGWKRI